MSDSPAASRSALVSHLQGRLEAWDPALIEHLELRKREELDFHNLNRDDSAGAVEKQQELDLFANKKWYSVTSTSQRYIETWIKTEAPHHVFLDYACGNGGDARRAARAGADLSIGLDISDVSIRNARHHAKEDGLADRCYFVQGDCEDTQLPDASIDRIICNGMLHHLDLSRAFPELRRILRPGGKILCIEALGHNPIIQWYRDHTPHLRTTWEAQHILRIEDVLAARKFFKLGQIHYWHLATLGAVPFRSTVVFRPLRAAGEAIDAVLLRIPGVRRWAWQFTFEIIHPDAS